MERILPRTEKWKTGKRMLRVQSYGLVPGHPCEHVIAVDRVIGLVSTEDGHVNIKLSDDSYLLTMHTFNQIDKLLSDGACDIRSTRP